MLTGHAAMAQNAFGSSTIVEEHFEIYYLTQKVLPLRFQRAINHIPKLNLTRIIYLCEHITDHSTTKNIHKGILLRVHVCKLSTGGVKG